MPIVDANVSLAWALPLQHSGAALALLTENEKLEAPSLLAHEITNAIWVMIHRGMFSAVRGNAILTDALSPVALLPNDSALATRALEIAAELDHPAYDAYYIAAAEAADTHFVTADRRLLAKLPGSAFADRVVELGA
jgi:predicted nucleic acid-binding protein